MSLLPLLSWSGNSFQGSEMLQNGCKFVAYCCVVIIFSMPILAAQANDSEAGAAWKILKEIHFEQRTIHENAIDILTIEAPSRAEDPAIVPLSIKAVQPQQANHAIKTIHLIIDNNPSPYSAKFEFSPLLETIDIATRVRVDRYTNIRAIAEMQDGSLHMVKTFVKASGGCSAPASRDAGAAAERLGQIQIRMRPPQDSLPTYAQVIVSHPNQSGLQIDQVSRGYIPAHFVENIEIALNGENLVSFEAGISISEDPSLRFLFMPERQGELTVEAMDSKQQRFHKTLAF